jgi:hypothetical protein
MRPRGGPPFSFMRPPFARSPTLSCDSICCRTRRKSVNCVPSRVPPTLFTIEFKCRRQKSLACTAFSADIHLSLRTLSSSCTRPFSRIYFPNTRQFARHAPHHVESLPSLLTPLKDCVDASLRGCLIIIRGYTMALIEHPVPPALRINRRVSDTAFLAVGMDNSGACDFVSSCGRCLTLAR